MKLLSRVDEWLMSYVFERFAWYSEYRWAMGHAVLARAVWGVLWFLASVAQDIINGRVSHIIVSLFGWYLVDKFIGQGIERDAVVKSGTMNPMRYAWRLRLAWALTCACLGTVLCFYAWFDSLYWSFFGLGCVSSMFFSHCNPMPPWYRQMQEARDAEKHFVRHRL